MAILSCVLQSRGLTEYVISHAIQMRSREAHHHVVPDLGRHEPLMDEKVSGKVFSDSDPREYTSVGLKKKMC